MKIWVDVVMIIEIDKDKNLLVQLIDSNIVGTDEYVENRLMFHRVTMMYAKQKQLINLVYESIQLNE
mgnify:CR=1 FL=1